MGSVCLSQYNKSTVFKESLKKQEPEDWSETIKGRVSFDVTFKKCLSKYFDVD